MHYQLSTILYPLKKGGFGVYKARMLAMDYVPNAYYDDLWICNNLGVYKNGNTRFANELNSLKNLKQGKVVDRFSGEYKVYPNPTTTVLNIQYVGDSEMEAETFILYDMTGKLIMRSSLSSGLSIINLPTLAKGMYTYTIGSDKGIVQRDKLLIE